MKWRDLFNFKTASVETLKQTHEQSTAYYGHTFMSFDGEKNFGEIGPIKEYWPDYGALRARSWQAYLESEQAQIIVKRFRTWVIGKGLKLQSEPEENVLKSLKINIDRDKFTESIEARFGLYSKSKTASHSGEKTLNAIASEAFLNSIVGGDVLVILRVKKGRLNVQLIDGAHLYCPFGSSEHKAATQRGNRIVNGIELSPSNEHIAYFVKTGLNVVRIAAKNSQGIRMAFLMYGLEYRIDSHRGLPLLTVVLESLKKLERYKEATIGSAEERQKIAYSIEHSEYSTGEDPNRNRLARIHDADAKVTPQTIDGDALQNKVAATVNKQAINLPNGATLKALDSKNELYFKEFYNVMTDILCASMGMPPEVAMSKYDSNFSASRAALKDWEHTLDVQRTKVTEQFYSYVYEAFLNLEILKGTIEADGYIEALKGGDIWVLEAYRNARFTGANVPHIDPLKEVQAVRAKLGPLGANIPLTTGEAGTEALSEGNVKHNITRFKKEVDSIDDLVPESNSTE